MREIVSVVDPRTYRSLLVPVAGRTEHQRLVSRVGGLPEATIRRSSLRRLGARKRRRLDTPTYESRVVVELVGVGPLRRRTPLPYRGVSRDDIDSIVAAKGGEQREIVSALVRFSANASVSDRCEVLLSTLRALVQGRDVELVARVVDNPGDQLAPYALAGFARGVPGAIADVSNTLSDSPLVLPWDMTTRWYDAR